MGTPSISKYLGGFARWSGLTFTYFGVHQLTLWGWELMTVFATVVSSQIHCS